MTDAPIFAVNSTDYGAYLRVLTGHKTVVETSLIIDKSGQSHPPMWMNEMVLLTHCLGDMLLKADYTPIILDTSQHATQLNSSYAYTVMHADLIKGVYM